MQIQVRGLVISFLLLLAFAAVSQAEDISVFNVHLGMSCPNNLNICSVTPYEGKPGNPAAGHVNFNAIDQPWSFSFETADPLNWKCDTKCENYNANFGVGGMFLMNGPDGQTFSGVITSGKAWQNLDLTYGANLSFSGEWSNGFTSTGSFLDQVTDQNGAYASLIVQTVPEPTSLALLGSGMMGLWAARKRDRF